MECRYFLKQLIHLNTTLHLPERIRLHKRYSDPKSRATTLAFQSRRNGVGRDSKRCVEEQCVGESFKNPAVIFGWKKNHNFRSCLILKYQF